MRNLIQAVEHADYGARRTIKVLLDNLEESNVLTYALRKVILDTINDYKREVVRYIFEIDE